LHILPPSLTPHFPLKRPSRFVTHQVLLSSSITSHSLLSNPQLRTISIHPAGLNSPSLKKKHTIRIQKCTSHEKEKNKRERENKRRTQMKPKGTPQKRRKKTRRRKDKREREGNKKSRHKDQ